jgi:hypothetical protein
MKCISFLLFSVACMVHQVPALKVPPRITASVTKRHNNFTTDAVSDMTKDQPCLLASVHCFGTSPPAAVGALASAVMHLRGGAEVSQATALLLLSRMMHVIQSTPILSNSLLCMCLSGIGDVFAQRFEHYEEEASKRNNEQALHPHNLPPIDVRRAATLASFGLLVVGPLLSTWYPFLHDVSDPWPLAQYGIWARPLVKVCLELVFLEPVFLCCFFGYMNFIKGGTIQTFRTKLRREFLKTYKCSLAFWPPVMLLSFRFVPVAALPVVVNVANIFWDGFLSYQDSHSSSSE